MTKGGPVFGKPGNWRSVISADRGARHLALDYIQLGAGEGFEHAPEQTEGIYVVIDGAVEVKANEERRELRSHDVIFVSSGDTSILSQTGDGPVVLIYCRAMM
jgi:mannose-6-phosphate isomerase-like protein (cupin superfamily)